MTTWSRQPATDVYVRGGEPAANGTRYSVVHVGDELRDPDNDDVLGYQGI